MKVVFAISYNTTWGQRLVVRGNGIFGGVDHFLTYQPGGKSTVTPGTWSIVFDVKTSEADQLFATTGID
jgi:hypothetical protein